MIDLYLDIRFLHNPWFDGLMEIEKSLFLGPQPWSISEWLSGQIFADICTSLSDVPDMSLANILFCTRKNKHLQAPT